MIKYSKKQYVFVRSILGFYLTNFFLQLFNNQELLFGSKKIFQNKTNLFFHHFFTVFEADLYQKAFLLLMIFAGISFMVGILTRFWSFVLWIGLVTVINSNYFLYFESLPFIGLLLLYFNVISPNKLKCKESFIEANKWTIFSAAIILNLGYTISAFVSYDKLAGLYSLDSFLLIVLGQSLFSYLLNSQLRKFSWAILLILNLYFLIALNFTMEIFPIIIFHFFVFNPNWFKKELLYLKKMEKNK